MHIHISIVPIPSPIANETRGGLVHGPCRDFVAFADTVSRSARVPPLLSLDQLRLDAVRGLLPAYVAGERVHQRAQIGELADGPRLAGASCHRHFVHGITRLQR